MEKFPLRLGGAVEFRNRFVEVVRLVDPTVGFVYGVRRHGRTEVCDHPESVECLVAVGVGVGELHARGRPLFEVLFECVLVHHDSRLNGPSWGHLEASGGDARICTQRLRWNSAELRHKRRV